jgi:hypothetical protein
VLFRSWDMLFLPCAHEAMGEKLVEAMLRIQAPRVYACVRPQRNVDRLLEVRLQQVAGQVIHRLKHRRLPVRVVFLPAPQCAVRERKQALQRKKAFYWHNHARNAFVASVAQACAAGNWAKLRGLGFHGGELTTAKHGKPRVAVLVESLRHAWALQQLLADWETRSMDNTTDKNTQGEANALVTAVYAATKPINADIIVCAAGTEWPMRLKRFPPLVRAKGAAAVLIIDFADAFSRQVISDTERRAKAYARNGYGVTLSTA